MVRTPARLLAPIAIAAVAVGAYVIVQSNVGTHSPSKVHAAPRAAPDRRRASAPRRRSAPTVYVVRAGDTLSAISVRTGVSLGTLETLNPSLGPSDSLHTGQRLRLRR